MLLSFLFLKEKVDRDYTWFYHFHNNVYCFDKKLALSLFNDSMKLFSFLACVSLGVHKRVLH